MFSEEEREQIRIQMLEDEAKLLYSTNAFIPDLEKESAITVGLLSYLEKVREDGK